MDVELFPSKLRSVAASLADDAIESLSFMTVTRDEDKELESCFDFVGLLIDEFLVLVFLVSDDMIDLLLAVIEYS